ncbi:MAG: hypothetical protein ACP5IX_02650 [Patescibacteria group bacterium]
MFEQISQNNQPIGQPGQPEPGFDIEKESESEEEEFISVMPRKFKKGKRIEPVKTEVSQIEKPVQKPKGKIFTILIIAIVVLAIIGGGVGFYFWAQSYLQAPKPPVTIPTQPVTQPTESPETRLSAEITEPTSQEIISTAELFFPSGALESGKVFEFKGIFQPSEAPTSTYQYLGGIYKISPEIPILKKAANLQISYATKLVDPSWESEIKIGYLKDNFWTILPSQIDVNTNTVSSSLEIIPADTFALLVEQTKIRPKVEEIQIGPQIFSSQDQDNDGLTDIEEQIYQTNPNNPDTDGDGQTDGLELINLSDPTHADGTLALSGLTKVFSNERWLYSFFYPSSWLTKSLPETDMAQIMVIANTGEFFEISVEENPERLTPKNWYLKQATNVNPDDIREATVVNQPAIWSPERLNLYISKEDKIYILTYNLGTEEEANFKATFKMIIKSFQFTEIEKEEVVVPEGKYRGTRPDGTLIKYATSTTVYLLENGKKRPIKSPEAYERLKFVKWKNIFVIPDEEWYPDGPMIE